MHLSKLTAYVRNPYASTGGASLGRKSRKAPLIVRNARCPALAALLMCSFFTGSAIENSGNRQTLAVHVSDAVQDRIVGRVVDGQNIPLPGVSIAVKGTTIRTQTDR